MSEEMTGSAAVHSAPAREGRGPGSLLEEGVLAGVVGAMVVALWFLVLDTARGQPLYTPTLLGSVLFLGTNVGEVDAVNVPIVFAYTGLHGVAFLVAGTLLAWMVAQFERNPQFGMVLLLVFLLFESVLFGFEVTLVPNLVGALGSLAVALANVLSAIAMLWLLLRRRPEAMARMRESWYE